MFSTKDRFPQYYLAVQAADSPFRLHFENRSAWDNSYALSSASAMVATEVYTPCFTRRRSRKQPCTLTKFLFLN